MGTPAPTPAPTPSLGQSLLTFLEDDTALAAAPALITLLTNVQAAQADPIKLQLAWIQFQGNIVQSVPTLESSFLGQLAQLVLTKVQAIEAQATAGLPIKL